MTPGKETARADEPASRKSSHADDSARAVAFVVDCRSPVSKTRRVTFAELAKRLGKASAGPKDGPAWLPAEIESGPRTAERVVAVSFLVLDVEARAEAVRGEDGQPARDTNGDVIKRAIGPEPPNVDVMLAELGLQGWKAILHTSYGHTTEHPRYRLVFDLSRALQSAELRPLGLHVVALLGIADCCDVACLEPARLFYLPRCPAERLSCFRHGVTAGAALDVDTLLGEARQIDAARREAATRRLGSQSGGAIDAFNTAYDVGMILERNGYTPKGRGRWLCQGSTTGAAGVRLLPDSDPARIYSSHGGDPLNDGGAHDAFDTWRILEHGGDMSAAVREAARLLGIAGAGRVPAVTDDGIHPLPPIASPADDSGEWPDPKPIQAELAPVPAFDADVLLPDALREWVMDESDRMPCPPDFIAAAALVELGAIVGARCAIKPKALDAWLVVPNLWGGIVGQPSAKKFPAIGVALKPLDRLIAQAAKAHEAEQNDYAGAVLIHEAREAGISSRLKKAAQGTKGGDVEGIAGELREHQTQAPQPPTLRRYRTNDTTVEKLGELLRDNPAGLLVLRDELVG